MRFLRLIGVRSMRDVAASIEGVDGWCTPVKAQKLYELASSPSCEIAVEIGIFGGKSLIPMALAFADKGHGCIYGVEPWDNGVAVETVTDDDNDAWWRTIDLVAIKRNFFSHVARLKIEKYVRILEIPSDSATLVFQTSRFAGRIDLVHVDGAHSVEQSVYDCALWLRLLKPGGHLVLDDTNWQSVKGAYDYLKAAAELVHVCDTEADGYFAVFRKP